MTRLILISGQNKVEVEVPNGTLIGEIVSATDLSLELPCAGRGTCGHCKLLVEEGGNEPDGIELLHLTEGELAVGTRLGCRVAVQGNTQVVLSPIEVHTNKVFRTGSRYRREKKVPLGMAIDLGTTTVAAYLTMLDNGEVLEGGAALNQQRVYGSDVLARLAAALSGEEHHQRLQRLAVSSIYQAVGSLQLSKSVLTRVKRVSVVGNAVMHHLMLGLPVESLAFKPFQPGLKHTVVEQPEILGGIFPANEKVIFPPLIGGFVGSDALACLAFFGMADVDSPSLIVDLGTNGEVLLTDGNRIVTASTAAGPAFEGADISCGMRAMNGAAVDVRFGDGRLIFRTIGDEPVLGLTGSGLLQTVSELLRIGVIEPNGRISESVPYFLSDRVSGVNRIYLTEHKSLWLTQKDIRELQKAKGAIRTAIEILMASLGLTPTDLGKIILTGSFGGQLEVLSVLSLGMLPDVAEEIIEIIPNGAGFGAAKFLFEDELALGEELAERTEQIELDKSPVFYETFIENLKFSQK